MSHLKNYFLHIGLQLNKDAQDVQVPCHKPQDVQSHIGKQLTVNLILHKTKLPTENSLLWQNPNREGNSSCLN